MNKPRIQRLPAGWSVTRNEQERTALFTFKGPAPLVLRMTEDVQSLAGSRIEGIPNEGFCYVMVDIDREQEAREELAESVPATVKPKNVRPSWVRVSVDDTANEPRPVSVGVGGRGPKSQSGSLSAEFLVRCEGEAVPCLTVDMIGSKDGASVLLEVRDSDGSVILSRRVDQ